MLNINNDTISVSMNGNETHAVMHAVVIRMQQLEQRAEAGTWTPKECEEMQGLFSFAHKCGPGIISRVAVETRLMRDRLN